MTRCAKATGAGMTASHLLPQRKGGSEAAGNPPAYFSRVQTAGYASNVPARGRPIGSPLLRSDPFALWEVRL